MRILHVLRAPVGGLFRHVVDLANGQIARGHQVGVIADRCTANGLSERTLADLAPKLALGLWRIPIRRQPGPADLVAVWRVAGCINATCAEVVHGHGAKGGALVRLAPARDDIIRVYTPHGGSLHDAVGGRLSVLLERALNRRGHLYLFESAYSHDVFHRKVGKPAGAVRIVHNGLRKHEFEPVALAAEASDIVYLGEMRALKGVDLLIGALAHLHRNGRPLTATLIGDGGDAAQFRAMVDQLGLAGSVTFRKPMPTREALALGRIVVLPSRAESLPYVVLEAAAAGKPLVATNVGGIPEIFGPHSDRLVTPDNVAALAAGIVEADRAGQGAELAQALCARVRTAFSADAMVEAVLRSYDLARSAAQQRRQAGTAWWSSRGQAATDR